MVVLWDLRMNDIVVVEDGGEDSGGGNRGQRFWVGFMFDLPRDCG